MANEMHTNSYTGPRLFMHYLKHEHECFIRYKMRKSKQKFCENLRVFHHISYHHKDSFTAMISFVFSFVLIIHENY